MQSGMTQTNGSPDFPGRINLYFEWVTFDPHEYFINLSEDRG